MSLVICEFATIDCPPRCPHRGPHIPEPLGEECNRVSLRCSYKSTRFNCLEIVEWAVGARLVIKDGKAHLVASEGGGE